MIANLIFVVLVTITLANAGTVILPNGLRQVHSQDILGQYYYGYNDGLSTKQETKTFDGITRGSYSYVDAYGKVQTVDYIADPFNGFRVAGTNLPKPIPVERPLRLEPVRDTPEVEAAKKEHKKLFEELKLKEKLPEMRVPEIRLPEIRVPEMRVPEMKVPEMNVPEIKMPEKKIKDIKVEKFITRRDELLDRTKKPEEIIIREPIITGTPILTPSLPLITPSLPVVRPIGFSPFGLLDEIRPISPLPLYNSSIPAKSPLLLDYPYRRIGGAPLLLI